MKASETPMMRAREMPRMTAQPIAMKAAVTIAEVCVSCLGLGWGGEGTKE